MAEDNTPTNVVDDGIELYHSISKGETVNKNFHAGTYNAALDRASQFYGGEQLYKIANDNLDFIQEQANDLVSELSEQVSFENVDDMFQITDDSVTREVSITLPTGNEARFNIVAETFDNTLTVKFQDVDGYDGGQIYSEELLDIDYEPDDLKTFVGDIDIVDDETVASNLLDEIGLKSQAGEFNYKDGYDLYKVNIKPGANVVNIPDTAIFIENGIEKEMSSDFIQGFIERPKEVNRFTDVTQIIIDNKTYDITDTFTSSQALQEHFKNADVLVYTNDIEDVGSKSYMFLNENSYVLEKIDNAQFNIDVANKYIKNNPYETISKLARREAFTEPERYQVLLNALLDETDTPTNVVDDAPLLETRMTQRNQGGLEWADDVITPNKVFNPDGLTRLETQIDTSSDAAKKLAMGQEVDMQLEGKYIWTRTTEFDAKAMYQRILDNKATDEDITKFFIYLASHSPETAFANSPFNQQHSIADIVKIGIFRDIPLTQVIPMGVPYQEAMFLDELFTNNNEIGDEIKKVLVELVTEQGQFQNLRERMRKVIMDAHKAVYANNPNDYFVVWRGGELNRFHPWQSTSKSYDSSNQVMMQMKQAGFANRYNVPDTYIVHKNNMIDLDALGLSWMDEKEIIVLTEELKSPFAKWEVPLYSDKEISGLEEWWSTAKTDTDSFPKNGKQITNISKSLSDAGQSTQDFFNIVLDGLDPRYIPNSGYQQLIDLNNTSIYKFQDDYNKFVASGGSFNQHIFTSVPTFYEAQVVKMAALSFLVEQNPLKRGEFGGPAQPYKILDIGGTEGAWAKGLGKNNPLVDIEVLDPSPVAEAKFNSGELVTNVKFTNEAFSHKLGDQDKFFIEQGQKPVRFKVFTDADKYDIIHESMAFQFIDVDRAGQIKYIKENLLNENGILIIEEKFLDDNKAIYDANEAKKDAFKRQYYTEEQLNNKKFNVLLDMEGNQVSVQEIQKILGENFTNVEQYWDSGNFKGFIASDSPVIESFKTGIQELDVSLTNHQYSTAPTNAEIKASINKMTYNHGTDKKLAAKIAEETVAQSPQYFNKLSKIAARFGVVGGTALAGLAKLAPALAPGDFAIEKAIEKSVPYLDDAAAKLGFARIPFNKLLPTYMAYEIGVAGADLVQAAMYAYETAAKNNQPSNFQIGLTKLLLPKAYEEEAIKKSQMPGDLEAFYNTPTGQKVAEELDFGSQFLKELENEKVSKYSPGWGLTKGLLSILGELAQYEAPEVTLNSSDYTTKLKENPAMIYNAGITGSNK